MKFLFALLVVIALVYAAQAEFDKSACLLAAETGKCRAEIKQFHYDSTAGACKEFAYGGCNGNANRFSTQSECEKSSCLLAAETGKCRAEIKQFHYDSTAGACKEFAYGGCNGNANRFSTQSECEKSCM